MTEAPKVTFESRMMIDGKLVDGEAGTFTNINPANEDVLGEVADASKADMNRAIDAARRAFDNTDWSTNRELRKRCLMQLHDAIESELEELREELILEVGAPRAVTHGPHLDAPLEDGLKYPARLIDSFEWESDLGDKVVSVTGVNTRRKVWHEPVGVVGAIVPWNFPFEVTINKLGQALATGNLSKQPEHPVQRNPSRQADRREDRDPSGCGQRRDGIGSLRRRGTHPVAESRHDLVHRFDCGR
jgi:acyl-CoA reductase-like NAD-dependent aldehyde dehydrogenase